MDILVQAFDYVAFMLASIGAFIIIYGGLFGAYHFVKDIISRRNRERILNVDHVRLEFGRNIVLGLEFFVAADIIQTVVTPDYYEIGLLGALVIIRTVLSYFLNREIVRLTPPDRNKLR